MSHQITVLVRGRTRRSFSETVCVLEYCSFNPQAFSSALRDVDHVIYALGLPGSFRVRWPISRRPHRFPGRGGHRLNAWKRGLHFQ